MYEAGIVELKKEPLVVPVNPLRRKAVELKEKKRSQDHGLRRKTKHDIVFAIPSVPRKGNPGYLEQTLASMTQHGVQAEQIWIHDRGDHALEAYRRVPTNPQSVNTDYDVTRPDDDQVDNFSPFFNDAIHISVE